MKRRLLALGLVLAGCSQTADLALDIRTPVDQTALAAVTQVNMSATRDGVVLAQASFAATANMVSLSGVSHGPRSVVSLDGVDSSGVVIARGRTCPIDFEAGTKAPLYFAPTNFFAPTAGSPVVARQEPVALALTDGDVLIAGGSNGAGDVYASSESFAPGVGTFAANTASLASARWKAQGVSLPSIGVLVTGGIDASGNALAAGELYYEATQRFLAIGASTLDARVGHRVVVLSDGRAFVTGGSNSDGGAPLDSTLFIDVLSDGTYQVTPGPTMIDARREHALILAVGIPIVFGGYGMDGAPLDSIEAIDPAGSVTVIAHLQSARAGATASLLDDGSILIVGGVGGDGAPILHAELYNPITQSTAVYDLATARRGHSATVLADGRVLIAGGFDAGGAALSSVELFAPGVGFLTERPLNTARGDHQAVALCDETVLIVGGSAAGAELYSEPAN